jgi:tetratricopeptide (TPR) repeat protein
VDIQNWKFQDIVPFLWIAAILVGVAGLFYLYQRLLKVFLSSRTTFFDAGIELYRKKHYLKAVRTLKDAQDLEELNLGLIQLWIGRCFRELGDVNQAKEHMAEALTYDPVNRDIKLELAVMLRDAGRQDEYEAMVFDMTEYNHSDPTLNLHLANIHLNRGRLTEAVPLLQSVLDHQAQNVWALAMLAQADAELGAFDLALQLIDRAILHGHPEGTSIKGRILSVRDGRNE